MKLLINIFYAIIITLVLLTGCTKQQNRDTKLTSQTADIKKVKAIIENLDKQFSKDFYDQVMQDLVH